MKSLKDEELRLKNKSIASTNFVKKDTSKSTSHINHITSDKKSIEDLD